MSDEWDRLAMPCQRSDLAIKGAINLFDHLKAREDGIVGDIQAYCFPAKWDAISFDIETNRPQEPAYPILRRERVSVCFGPGEDRAPCVFAMRDNFPSTPHQNLVPEGFPTCLCVDDRAWIDARPTWSSRELVYRIARWFERAGMGDLHDTGQMIDPFFQTPGASVIVPRIALDPAHDTGDFVGVMKDVGRPIQVLSFGDAQMRPHRGLPIVFHLCAAKPIAMDRIRKLPRNLAKLFSDLDALGIDLRGQLKEKITALDKERQNSLLIVVVMLPVIEPSTNAIVREDLFAYLTSCPIGDVGIALGLLLKNDSGVRVGSYVPNILARQEDTGRLESVALQPLQVHPDFDAALAAQLSGRPDSGTRKMVMIGAGAIGSAVIEPLVREGRSDWAIVDPDLLFPHNLARHTLTGLDVADYKTRGLTRRLQAICAEARIMAIEADVLDERDSSVVRTAFDEAEIIIDAAASVPVARYVSDLDGKARRASIFFNPKGHDAVMLVEDAERRFDLRYLEARYYAAILEDPRLDGHLTKATDTVAFAGGCRAVTSRIPAWRAQTLSGLVAGAFSHALDRSEEDCRVWRLGSDLSVEVVRVVISSPTIHRIGEWTIVVPDAVREKMLQLRSKRLPAETGGILLGVLDLSIRRIDLVSAWPEPRDSASGPAFFERGVSGLDTDVSKALAKTADQVRYVGEWHSHPDLGSTMPSVVDRGQIATFTEILDADDCPFLMVIVDENGLGLTLGQKL